MVKKIIETADDLPTTTGPRISWSVIVMGASVLVSMALNYAAYDTRITVLERSALSADAKIVQAATKNDTLSTNLLQSQSQVVALQHDIESLRERLQRIETQQDSHQLKK